MVGPWLALLLASAPERAELVLQWDVPAECPSAADIRTRVSEQWGARDVAALDAHGVITAPAADAPLWRLVLTLHSGDGEAGKRVVEARSCEALADAAVLVLTVAAITGERSTAIAVPAPVVPP
ncbi:MAG: hypothetical protein IAG13_30300, partial [Deltaproteobacteria bacterium]|nr:hypothetical protein [Nannocystaceae bacterium]